LVTAVLNVNCYTYTVAPVFTMMEVEVLKGIAHHAGFDVEQSEGKATN
jgi:glutamate decarboxylase/sulfinoalanine decarboxylase